MRKKKSYRRVAMILIILAITFTAFNLLPQSAEGESTKIDNNQELQIVVKQGDNLWDLAAAYGPSNKDLRKIIYQIEKRNNLKSSKIYTGQVLVIPTK